MACSQSNFNGVCSYWDEDHPDEAARNGIPCDENGYCGVEEDPDPCCPFYDSIYDEDNLDEDDYQDDDEEDWVDDYYHRG